ncbi:carbohydrate ABC transporter substrate-binding protein [Oscillospiraceae bacterium MB08-C2-2]|nr:carbohydrate ABC transporter substrate-binding protein [Oscillospiraceae bacterium MB08-C2-2]
MKMHKRILAFAMVSLMLILTITACGSNQTPNAANPAPSSQGGEPSSETPPASASDKTLRIFAWNEEFQSRFNDYFIKPGKLPADIQVEWVITPNENNAYQNKLDAELRNQDSSDNKIDIFLIEADYAAKYVDTDYSLDVKADVGLTDADLKDQYKYTQEIVTNTSGKLKGVTWQATPGLFAYRRSIAKDVLGTDDPAEVQKYLSDWDKFNEIAVKMNAKGYRMLSGYDDSYRTFANNISAPWVDANDVIRVDENMFRWVDQTKDYTDKGYNNKTALWAPEWGADQGPEGKVFGFFYSTWGINFTLLGNSLAVPLAEGGKAEVGNGIYGDYAVCEGPESYYWGGTWICAAKGSDNIDLVREVMLTLTSDAATMKQITLDTEDYTNNQAAMTEIANSDYQSAFLGGQNHIKMFAAAAPNIDMSNISKYDQGMTEEFQKSFKDYFDGNVSREEALENFYTAVIEKYPNLKKPA